MQDGGQAKDDHGKGLPAGGDGGLALQQTQQHKKYKQHAPLAYTSVEDEGAKEYKAGGSEQPGDL